MSSLVRIKRAANDDPIDLLLLTCKRAKSELQTDSRVFKFAATVDDRNGDVKTQINEFIKVRQSIKINSTTVSSITQKLKTKNKLLSHNNRLKVINCFRAKDSLNEDEKADKGKTYTVVDIEKSPFIREEPKGSSSLEKVPLTEEQYVYDLYYSTMGDDCSDIQMENVLSAHQVDEQLVFDDYLDEDEDDCFVADDEDDSNDENNWRNDYPDSDKDDSSLKESDDDDDEGDDDKSILMRKMKKLSLGQRFNQSSNDFGGNCSNDIDDEMRKFYSFPAYDTDISDEEDDNDKSVLMSKMKNFGIEQHFNQSRDYSGAKYTEDEVRKFYSVTASDDSDREDDDEEQCSSQSSQYSSGDCSTEDKITKFYPSLACDDSDEENDYWN